MYKLLFSATTWKLKGRCVDQLLFYIGFIYLLIQYLCADVSAVVLLLRKDMNFFVYKSGFVCGVITEQLVSITEQEGCLKKSLALVSDHNVIDCHS